MISLFHKIVLDFKGFRCDHSVYDLLFSRGFLGVVIFRVRRFLFALHIPFIRSFLALLSEVLTGVDIDESAIIGGGFVIYHGGPVLIGRNARIGYNAKLRPMVVIGEDFSSQGSPTIGDNVDIGVGAKIIGPVVLGNSVRIGANSVVINSFPDGCTIAGVPARIIKKA